MVSFALAAAAAKPPTWVTVLIYGAIIAAGSLATLFSLIFLGGRVVRPRSVRRRLRAGVAAALIVIALAALDIYLAITGI